MQRMDLRSRLRADYHFIPSWDSRPTIFVSLLFLPNWSACFKLSARVICLFIQWPCCIRRRIIICDTYTVDHDARTTSILVEWFYLQRQVVHAGDRHYCWNSKLKDPIKFILEDGVLNCLPSARSYQGAVPQLRSSKIGKANLKILIII